MYSLYYNGKILTMAYKCGEEEVKNEHEAVLVEDGTICAVGKKEALMELTDGTVLLRDLHGCCLMPAFIDAHSHFVMSGQMAMCAKLQDCESYGDIIFTLRQYMMERHIGKGQVVLGFGYDHNFLKEGGHPDKRILDQVSEEIPVFVLHISGHLACVNGAALRLAGITKDMQNPQGGVLGRIEGSNELSGYLEEAGLQLVQKALIPFIQVNPFKMIQETQDNYLKYGITTVQDGAVTQNELAMLKNLSEAGLLKIDVVAYPLMTAGGVELKRENEILCGTTYRGHIRIGGYKLVLDGSPQGRSAWMSEPYLGDEKDYCGYPWMQNKEAEEYIKIAVRERQQLLVHCNGDAASDQFLDSYEKALKEEIEDASELRPVMIHCQTVRNDQLDRMAKLNMVASIFVGHVWYWGDVHIKNFGKKRGNRISPVKDAISRGVHVNFHQDTPVTKPDMLHSVWCAVNRISRQGNIIGTDQKVSVYDALRAVTVEAAYQYFEEGVKGTIEVGKRADLVVLDRCPLDVSDEDIWKIKVIETIKDGKTLYKLIDGQ